MRTFVPSRPYTTKVKRWTWTPSRGLWVEYVDGFRWKSDWTLRELLAGGIKSGDGLPAEEVTDRPYEWDIGPATLVLPNGEVY